MVVFGPVPSRRLGRSLGINNIPAKSCSYSCIYCQLGPTETQSAKRRSFYKTERILKAVEKQLGALASDDRMVDYLTFVPDGEPTLDVNLQEHISSVGDLEIPVAIISNASLIWDNEVQDALLDADLVSLKVDAVSDEVWKAMNRPHKSLELERILEGVTRFADQFPGEIITETMMTSGVDYTSELEGVAEFLSQVSPKKAYISVPTRPPCEDWVRPVSEKLLNRAFQAFASNLGHERVELLIGYEGDAFASTGDVVHDLLSITSVHPMREDAVLRLLEKNNADRSVLGGLLDTEKMVELEYSGHKYYARKLGEFR